MFNIKLELGLDVNVKLDPINLQFDSQRPLESRLGLDADAKLGYD